MEHPSRRIVFGLVACLLLSGEALGCSIFLPVIPFEPDAIAARGNVADAPTLPAVQVQVGAIQRTSSAVDCDFQAEIDLDLSWSEPTPLRWDDVGFYVRTLYDDGTTPQDAPHVHRGESDTSPFERDGISPEMAHVANGKARLKVWVPDSPQGGVLDFDVEIVPIDRRLRLGPKTRIHVHSAARPAEQYEARLRVMAHVLSTPSPDAVRELRSSDDPLFWSFTDALRARIQSGVTRLEPCGVYSPYGCGATETALLGQGEMEISTLGRPRETFATACVGVRQSTGRVVRIVFTDQKYRLPIATAEWVDDIAPGDWSRVAAGCAGLFANAIREQAAYEADYAARARPRR